MVPAEFDAEGAPKQETIKPLIDGGTEGFKGHARVIYPGMTPCFDCTLWLFPPQLKFPLCTLAETPRSAAHCIEYAHLILWGRSHSDEFDSDNEAHMRWVRPHSHACIARCCGRPNGRLHSRRGSAAGSSTASIRAAQTVYAPLSIKALLSGARRSRREHEVELASEVRLACRCMTGRSSGRRSTASRA